MSAQHTPTQWDAMVLLGFASSAKKGSPSITHAKKPGEWVAYCGARPGPKSAGSTHRNRTGWYVGSDKPPTCKACSAKIAEAMGAAS